MVYRSGSPTATLGALAKIAGPPRRSLAVGSSLFRREESMQSLSLPVRQLTAVAPSGPCGLVRLILAVAMAFSVAAPELHAQNRGVAGTVRRASPSSPSKGQRVQIEGSGSSRISDAAGRFA